MRCYIRFGIFLVLAPFLLAPGTAIGRPWDLPACARVEGLASVSYTSDEGNSYAANAGLFLPAGHGTFGIAALGEANVLLAEFEGSIYRSTDAGCSWREYATGAVSPLRFSNSSGSVAYAWGFFPGPGIWRANGKAGPPDRLVPCVDLPANVLGVAVDPADPDRVRAACSDGRIYESRDGGASRWTPVGNAAPVSSLTYFAAFDPSNLDNAVIGMARHGVFATLDGGVTWRNASGLSSTAGPANSFNGVFSPAVSGVVYVMSLDRNESDQGAPSQGRHIYRSDDGGFSFTPVVDQGGAIILTNGPTMAADPADSNVVYFTFGERWSLGGVYLYRYDHAAGTTTMGFDTRHSEIRSLTFNPASSSVIYAGFEGG